MNSCLRRHRFGLVAAVLAALGAAPTSSAQSEDVPTLRLVVPCAAGTPADLLARQIANSMAKDRKGPVIVSNIAPLAGGSGDETEWVADARTVIFRLFQCGDDMRQADR